MVSKGFSLQVARAIPKSHVLSLDQDELKLMRTQQHELLYKIMDEQRISSDQPFTELRISRNVSFADPLSFWGYGNMVGDVVVVVRVFKCRCRFLSTLLTG